ncbi:beta-galactosidase [Phenylobacterium sp.]|uniref:beta-galactosidase n=1 Tax=Phenylobacterium sp. TaxID=1871053 RepID=UPI0028120448|nr:beta-galactosidase [Phenylobacterium sp.]
MQLAYTTPFNSYFMGGFDCASHRRRDGARVDSLVAQRHDRFAAQDYAAVAAHGLRTVRDGLRWHLIEPSRGTYDWSSWRPMLRAAREAGVQVIWDLWHYGHPDWLDIWSPDFVERIAAYAEAAARVLAEETDEVPIWCPMNEISYFAYMAGDQAEWLPYASGEGVALKRQLIRAAIAATDAVRRVDPRARILWCEPCVHIVPQSMSPADVTEARIMAEAQWEAFDMLAGRREPELGGRPDVLDIVGLNFYSHNQWTPAGNFVPMGHHSWRPFSTMLTDIASRYGRPVIVAETGAEGSARAAWLSYVASEVEEAREAGVPVQGVCLYPVCNYPGWNDGRLCPTGLLGMADDQGSRPVHQPLARELRRRQDDFERAVASPVLLAAE